MSIFNMDKNQLIWTEQERKKILETNVFSVWESNCKSPSRGQTSRCLSPCMETFTVLDAADWAIVIPIISSAQGDQFVMVRQWRHGARKLSLEFPGGVFEPGENPEAAAARELQEETGLYPGKIVKIGEFNPNPAIMTNTVHFFLASELTGNGLQNLDKDEFVEVLKVDVNEVIQGMGKEPYIHALMGTALSLYLKLVCSL